MFKSKITSKVPKLVNLNFFLKKLQACCVVHFVSEKCIVKGHKFENNKYLLHAYILLQKVAQGDGDEWQ